MNASYEWLRALVPFALTPPQLRDLLTARCATVDEVVPLRDDLAPIVIGRVVEARPHPNSDRLTLTKVDVGGGELLDVVCGAPNVRVGATYPFAPVGAVLPGGVKIERRKIRGETSSGMLCSARELRLGSDSEGILELQTDAAPGTPLLRAVALGDTRLVVDVGANRPDLLSHLGLAREIAAATGLRVTVPPIDGAAPAPPRAEPTPSAGRAGALAVRVEDAGRCPRYAGVVIRGVRVGPSPDWLVRRLEAVGARSVNNVVDASNYVLHELGQPTHAFDLAKLEGPEVVIRLARAGERIVTLDGVERPLTPQMLVIADVRRPQAIAGVMGGRESEVNEGTTDLFIEVATFEPRSIRSTRRALGMSTEASYRFERGTDPELPPLALERTVEIITAIAGGRVDGSPVDIYTPARAAAALVVRADRVARVLGQAVPAREMVTLLASIGFQCDIAPGTEMLAGHEELRVVPPSWRRDVTLEVDVIEEVARLHGYDAIPSDLRAFRPGNVPDDPLWLQSRRVRDTLVAAGLLEARPLPFVAGGDDYVPVSNPLAANEAYLRRDVLESLARRAEYNLSHKQGNVRLFEIGAAFAPSGGPLPAEEMRVGLLVMGQRRPPHFTEKEPPAFDEWDAKAFGELLARSAFPEASVALEPAPDGGTLWRIVVDGEALGAVRRVALDAPVWARPAFGAELRLSRMDASPVPEQLTRATPTGDQRRPAAPRYRPLPVTFPSEIDIALVVPDGVAAADVERVIRDTAGELLERLTLFDEYRGEHVPAGHRSLAWRLTLRHPERALRDKDVEARRDKILRTLEHELGVRQRTS